MGLVRSCSRVGFGVPLKLGLVCLACWCPQSEGVWLLLDDALVQPVDESVVSEFFGKTDAQQNASKGSDTAYILFYQARNCVIPQRPGNVGAPSTGCAMLLLWHSTHEIVLCGWMCVDMIGVHVCACASERARARVCCGGVQVRPRI